MDLRQLEVYVAVVKYSSFSRASEKLFISQPTVSAHIISLEKELAVNLLIRNTRDVYPTEAGKKLFEYAVKMLHLRDEAIEDVGLQIKLHRGIINILASTIPAKHIIPELIFKFRKEYPDIIFNIINCDSLMVCKGIIKGEARIGFSGSTSNNEYCRHYPIAKDKLIVITQNNEKFAKIFEKNNYFEILLKEPFIFRNSGSGTRYEFEQYLDKNKFKGKINIVAEMADTEAIKNSVAAGIGISVISERAATDTIRFGLIKSFPLPGGGERSLYLVRKKKDRLVERERLFCNFVIKQAEKI